MLSANEIEIEIDSRVAVTTTIVTTTITVSRSLIALQPSLAALYIQQWFPGFAATYFGNRWTQTGAIVERDTICTIQPRGGGKPNRRRAMLTAMVSWMSMAEQ
jgi:hypothetical protein